MSAPAGQGEPWVVLATSTIDPRGMRFTARSEPLLRLEDYKRSLRHWCGTTSLPLVFCENSGADLHSLQQTLETEGERIEWLGFDAPGFPEHLGQGYGEALTLRHALDNSRLIGVGTRVVKVTGRLSVRNFGRSRPDSSDVRRTSLATLIRRPSSTRTVGSSPPRPSFLYNYLLSESEIMDELAKPMVNLERVLTRAILKAIAAGHSWRAPPSPHYYEGFSGTFGHQYQSAPPPTPARAAIAKANGSLVVTFTLAGKSLLNGARSSANSARSDGPRQGSTDANLRGRSCRAYGRHGSRVH